MPAEKAGCVERNIQFLHPGMGKIMGFMLNGLLEKLFPLLKLAKECKMRKTVLGVVLLAIVCSAWGETSTREYTIRQTVEIQRRGDKETKWTSEAIQKDPYQFLLAQLGECDKLKAKIEANNITLTRMEKKAQRLIEESDFMIGRYSKFLTDAKEAYKKNKGEYPVVVNGYSMNEDELEEKITEAMERVELAKKDKKDNMLIAKKVSIRKDVLKKKKRELSSLRLRLLQQSEQVKANAELADIEGCKENLAIIQDMMIEIDEDPTKLSIDDLMEEPAKAKRHSKVNSFLED